MSKAKDQRPATKEDLLDFLKIISGRFDILEEYDSNIEGRLDKSDKNLEAFKQEARRNFREQGQKLEENNQKLGIVERSLEPLNKRIRYQKDMPERSSAMHRLGTN